MNETSLEDALINIAGFVDERGMKIALRGLKLLIPRQLQFVAERLMVSNLRVGTADNDTNAIKSMGMLPDGYAVQPCRPAWKPTSTRATCASKRVSVTALGSLIPALYSRHPAQLNSLSSLESFAKRRSSDRLFLFV